MESLDKRIQERVLEKIKGENAYLSGGREFISCEFKTRCNYILVFTVTFSFNGKKPRQEQFNFDLYKEDLATIPGMIY